MAWQILLIESGRCLPLAPGDQILGSDSRCAIRIEHPTVSRKHARLNVGENHVRVEDAGSSNGTRIEGRLISQPVRVAESRRLTFGMVEALLQQVDEAEAKAAVVFSATSSGPVASSRSAAATLAAASTARFAVEAFPELLAFARQRRDPGSLAARMMAALCHEFQDLEFSIEAGEGRPLAGRRIEAEAMTETCRSDRFAIRVHGPRARRANALPALRLCAGLLDLVDAAGSDTPARAASDADGHRRPAPAARPEPATLNRAVIETYDRAERVAPSALNVLILGETGTGKELLARFLHVASRREGTFVAVNCAALSRDLLEAELFGIEAGVATGVSAREGRFVQADGGTLLLDEVTEMPDDCQAKLLRVLQEGEIVAVGARRPKKVDVRVIAATNRSVSSRSDEPGPLRPDLVHRLSGWKVTLPPLRDRSEDIPQLAGHFLAGAARAAGRRPAGISRAAMDALCAHDWHGNVRELEQEMQRAALFVDDGELLGRRHLSPDIAGGKVPTAELQDVSADAQRKAIEQTLAAHDGNATRAAEVLGISRATLYRRMKDFSIQR
ncbi:MAG: sigma 54-interacting transcriptional regulator [Wenzhouxiangellaceae bacterium]